MLNLRELWGGEFLACREKKNMKKFNVCPSFAICAYSVEIRPGMSRHSLDVSKLDNFASRHGGINSTERAENC